MINPMSIPFSLRTNDWLSVLRKERIEPLKIKRKASVDKDQKFLNSILKLMTKEQIAGYMKGMCTG